MTYHSSFTYSRQIGNISVKPLPRTVSLPTICPLPQLRSRLQIIPPIHLTNLSICIHDQEKRNILSPSSNTLPLIKRFATNLKKMLKISSKLHPFSITFPPSLRVKFLIERFDRNYLAHQRFLHLCVSNVPPSSFNSEIRNFRIHKHPIIHTIYLLKKKW